jgi:hypothetical protein
MKVVIWGAADMGNKALKICELLKIEVLAFLDSDVMKQGKYFEATDIKIYDPSEFKNIIGYENTPIIIATKDKRAQNESYIMSLNIIELSVLQNAWMRLGKKDYPRVQLGDKNIEKCQLLSTREVMLEKFPSEMIMAEIGSFKGDFAQEILITCKPSKLYLIDAWEGERWEQYYQVVKEKFKNEIASGQVEIVKGYSTEELKKFKDNELDWVYIDTVHDYSTTREELEICHSKIKKDGFICGHDYTNYNVRSRVEYGVWAAVNEFIMKNNYELKYMTMEPSGCKSFCLQMKLL